MTKTSEKIQITLEEGIPLIDGHCHIPWIPRPKGMTESYEDQIRRFFENNGQYLISCSVDWKSLQLISNFIRKHENIGLTAGWAPQTVTYTESETHEIEFQQWLEFLFSNPDDYLGIGEIGLDFHHAKTIDSRVRQIEIFTNIIEATKSLNKPYILHVRNPGPNDRDLDNPDHEYNGPDVVNKIIIEILNREQIPPSHVIWHCFSGPPDWGIRLAAEGYYLSVPSSAYGFKSWRNNIQGVALEQLLTETDSSSQHPYDRSGINEPVNVKYSVAAIAFTNELNQQEVAKKIIENFSKLYQLEIK